MSSMISYNVVSLPSSVFLNPLPILCKTLICDLDGDANTILCRFLIFIPVLNVPREATVIESFCFSTIALMASLSVAGVFHKKKKILRLSFTLFLIMSYSGLPCLST